MALKRPSPQRLALLNAVAEAHDAWVASQLRAGGQAFVPREEGSDYNQHYIDVEAGAVSSGFVSTLSISNHHTHPLTFVEGRRT